MKANKGTFSLPIFGILAQPNNLRSVPRNREPVKLGFPPPSPALVHRVPGFLRYPMSRLNTLTRSGEGGDAIPMSFFLKWPPYG